MAALLEFGATPDMAVEAAPTTPVDSAELGLPTDPGLAAPDAPGLLSDV